MKIGEPLSLMVILAGLSSSCASWKGQMYILRMIAEAKTSADHEAIAEYHDRHTTEAERSAQLHEAMPKGYRRTHPVWNTPRHCAKIAQYFEGISQQTTENTNQTKSKRKTNARRHTVHEA